MSDNFDPVTGKKIEAPVSVGEWLGTMLLLLIPLVNIIMVFVWAFGGGAKASKANYFKAYLILAVIGIALGVVSAILFGAILWPVITELVENGSFQYGY